MHEPPIPMLFPVLGAHISDAKSQYSYLTRKEICGQMAILVADSGVEKRQLTTSVKAIPTARR